MALSLPIKISCRSAGQNSQNGGRGPPFEKKIPKYSRNVSSCGTKWPSLQLWTIQVYMRTKWNHMVWTHSRQLSVYVLNSCCGPIFMKTLIVHFLFASDHLLLDILHNAHVLSTMNTFRREREKSLWNLLTHCCCTMMSLPKQIHQRFRNIMQDCRVEAGIFKLFQD